MSTIIDYCSIRSAYLLYCLPTGCPFDLYGCHVTISVNPYIQVKLKISKFLFLIAGVGQV